MVFLSLNIFHAQLCVRRIECSFVSLYTTSRHLFVVLLRITIGHVSIEAQKSKISQAHEASLRV